MESRKLANWLGASCALGLLVMFAGLALDMIAPAAIWIGDRPYVTEPTLYRLYGLTIALGALGTLAGAAGVYLRVAPRGGIVGKLGLTVAAVGALAFTAAGLAQAILATPPDNFSGIALLCLSAGMLLLGIAGLAARAAMPMSALAALVGVWPLIWLGSASIGERFQIDGIWTIMSLGYLLLWAVVGLVLWFNRAEEPESSRPIAGETGTQAVALITGEEIK